MNQQTVQTLRGFYNAYGSLLIIIVAAILFFYTLSWCLDTYPPKDDVINFYNQAEMIKSGMVPYRDFVFEFPPFALAFFLIPSMFTSDLVVYAQIFGVMVTVVSLVCLYYMLRICDRIGINKILVSVVFVLLMLMYYTEMVKKFDVIPMATSVMSVYYFMRGNRYSAYGLAAVGALTKIYPVLLIVLFIILDLHDRRDSRRVRISQGIVACVVAALVAVVPLLVAGATMGDIMSFLTFHTDRGFQVESVMGVIIQALGLAGATEFTLESVYGTYDVISPVSDMFLPYWNYLVAAVVILVLAAIWIRSSDHGVSGTSDRDLLVYIMVLLLAFILTNKVFSTQYMLWLFPFLSLLAVPAGGFRASGILMSAYVLVMELFAAIMMMDYNQGTVTFVVENLCRDLMLMVLFVSLLLYILGHGFIFRHMYGREEPRSIDDKDDGTGAE